MRTPVADSQVSSKVAEGVSAEAFFSKDQFALRRSNSGSDNPYDPDSLLTGLEIEQGFDYDNSYRVFPSQAVLDLAVAGDLSTAAIIALAPRRFRDPVGSSAPAIVGDKLANISEGEVLKAFNGAD